MKTKLYEIYTKNPETQECGWDIEWVRSTDELIKTYPNFDVVITVNDPCCGVDVKNWQEKCHNCGSRNTDQDDCYCNDCGEGWQTESIEADIMAGYQD